MGRRKNKKMLGRLWNASSNQSEAFIPICMQDPEHEGPGMPWYHYREVNGRLEPDPQPYPDQETCIVSNQES
jgi:hypothetical protein